MPAVPAQILYLVCAALFILGLKRLSHPRTAVAGNRMGAAAMLLAVLVTLFDRQIVGYDVDFVKAIANKLGVKLELKAVTSASRMPQLIEGNIDIIAATMTKTPERAQQIDFSNTYFLTGQKFFRVSSAAAR